MPGQALLRDQPGNTNWMPWEKKTKRKRHLKDGLEGIGKWRGWMWEL